MKNYWIKEEPKSPRSSRSLEYDKNREKAKNYDISKFINKSMSCFDNYEFKVSGLSDTLEDELNWLFKNVIKSNITTIVEDLIVFGDCFCEMHFNEKNMSDGVLQLFMLKPETVYRIETTDGMLLEFQQGSQGPDFQALIENYHEKSTALRLSKDCVTHFRMGDTPIYGTSLLEEFENPIDENSLIKSLEIPICSGLEDIARKHLKLRNVKENLYENLKISMKPFEED